MGHRDCAVRIPEGAEVWRSEGPRNWPSGPWDSEPDRIAWWDRLTGLPCLVLRHPSLGHLNGYVGIEHDHLWSDKGDDEIELDAHGGITYSGPCIDGDAKGDFLNKWYFGFDCGHSWDWTPRFPDNIQHGSYKEVDYVVEECERLAIQLALIRLCEEVDS